MSIGRLHISQVRLVGVDLVPAKAAEALRETRSHNQRVSIAAGDACRLPFRDGVFDATFCVAVLQHVSNVSDAIAEIARVTAPGRRVVIVEPDNAARYLYSSVPAGAVALAAATRFFAAVADARERATHPAVGPRVPSLLATAGIEAVDVRLFPVTSVQLGVPPDDVWTRRRARVEQAMAAPPPTACATPRWSSSRRSTPIAPKPPKPTPRSSRSRTRCSLPRSARSRPPAASASVRDDQPPRRRPRATKAGTSTRRSTTGRTPARSAGATCRSGARSRCTPAARCSSSAAARDASPFPLARAGVPLVGIDRSAPMLARARQRVKRARLQRHVRLVRGDIRFLPFADARSLSAAASRRRAKNDAGLPRRSQKRDGGFSMVLAPYGMLQSLLRERDLKATLAAVHRVLQPGGTFGVELVADLPVVAGVPQARQPEGLAIDGRRARHAHRDGAPGPEARLHDLRSGVHRAPRHPHARRGSSR